MARLALFSRNDRHLPNLNAWGFSFLSLALVTTLGLTTLLVAHEISQELSFRKLSRIITKGEIFSDLTPELEAIFAYPKLTPFLSELLYDSPYFELIASAERKREIVKALHDTIIKLEQSEFVDAEAIYTRTVKVQFVELISTLGSTKEGSEILKDIESKLETASSLYKHRDELKEQIGKLDWQAKSLRYQNEMLKKDLIELLAIPAERYVQSENFVFYTDGILSKLPVIEGLDNGIIDLVTLKNTLTNLSVDTSTLPEDAQLLVRIEELRVNSTRIKDEFDQTIAQESSFNESLKQTELEFESGKLTLTTALSKLLVVQARPELNPISERLIDWFGE